MDSAVPGVVECGEIVQIIDECTDNWIVVVGDGVGWE